MIIKVKEEKQIEQVARLAARIWKEHYEPILVKGQVDYMVEKYQSKAAIMKQIKNNYYDYYLIMKNSIPIGYFGIVIEKDAMFLSKFYIDKNYRGKGYGRLSIDYMHKLAIENKLQKIYLTVNKHNTNSIKAYKKIGFDVVKDIVTDIGNGYVMDDYQLEFSL